MLLHGISLTDGHGILQFCSFFTESFEVDSDAEGSSDFVLTTITASNCSAIVVLNVHPLLEFLLNFFADPDLFFVFLEEGEDCDFDGSDFGRKAHYGTNIGLAAFFGEVFFVEGLAEKSENRAVATCRRFNDMRNELFFSLVVSVFERFTGSIVVLGEIVRTTISNSFEFLNAKGEFIFDIVGFFRVVGPLAVRDIEDVEFLARNANFGIPLEAVLEPFVG